MEITSVKFVRSVRYTELKYWEMLLVSNEKTEKSLNIKLETMKSLGVANRFLDGTVKVVKFLNSEKGLSWLNENLDKTKIINDKEFL